MRGPIMTPRACTSTSVIGWAERKRVWGVGLLDDRIPRLVGLFVESRTAMQ